MKDEVRQKNVKEMDWILEMGQLGYELQIYHLLVVWFEAKIVFSLRFVK